MDETATDSPTTSEQRALGAFIRERRTELGLTQTQLAERVGWVQERISLLETGKYGMPSVPALTRLASALDTRLFAMLGAAGYDEEEGAPASDGSCTGPRSLQNLLAIPTTPTTESRDQMSDLIAELVRADTIDVFMYEPESDSLVALGTSKTPMVRRHHANAMKRLPVRKGGREVEVFQTGEPYSSGTTMDDPGMSDGRAIQSITMVPLDVAGCRRGVLVAETSRQNVSHDLDARGTSERQ